jgi:O-antigen/teichoic acid export membrane protein
MRLQKHYIFIRSVLSGYGRYLSNLSATFVSQAVTALSILLITPVLLKNLGSEQFGNYFVLLNVIVFCSIFDFGLNMGLLRKLIHNRDKSQWVINAMFFFFLIVFVASFPLFYFLYRSDVLKSDGQFLNTAIFVALIVMQNIIAVFFDIIIQSANKIFVGKLIRIFRTVIEFVVLFFVSKQGSVSWLLGAIALINFFYIGALFIYSKQEVDYRLSWSYFRASVLWEHIRYSFWYFQNTLATALVFSAQVILISSYIDKINVAKYLLVLRFYDVIRTGLANFTTVLFPSLSMLQAQENWTKLRAMFLKVLLRVTLIVIIVFSLVLTVGQKFFINWSSYGDANILLVFRLYSLYLGLLVIDHVANVFLAALKFNKYPSIIGTVQGVIGLLLSTYFLPRYGIAGAMYASLIALCCTNLFFNPLYLFKKLNYHQQVANA